MTKGEDMFCKELNEYDWTVLQNRNGPEEKTEFLHGIIEKLKNKCFPLKTVKIRDDEDPWVTEHLRRVINKKRREYGKNGKSPRYFRLSDAVEVGLSESRSAYYDRELQKMSSAGRGLAYTALRNLKSAERPKSWSLADLDKQKPVEHLMENAAEFFSSVSNNCTPVTATDIPLTYDRPIYDITAEMVIKRVKETKKPNSMVPGDVPPSLITRVIESLSIPLVSIYNDVPKYMLWPSKWRMEYQTIIPKKPNPTNLNEVRNLSCTNFFSKILESFVDDLIRSEVNFSELQYGGLKGTGTDNFLCEVWNNVLETLEIPDRAVGLMSVDFLKAFNRLSHVSCLEKLAAKNASNQTLGLVFSFLQDRKMAIRVNNMLSKTRPIRGG